MKLTTKTTKGAIVTLSLIDERIKADVDTPMGHISGFGTWGTHQGVDGMILSYAKVGKKYGTVVLSIPKEDYDKINLEADKIKNQRLENEKREEEERKQKALSECPDGYVIARCNWSNGDLMSAEYQTEDGTKITWVDMQDSHYGWYYVPKVEVEKKRKEIEEKAKKESEESLKREKIEKTAFENASISGEKQFLRSFNIDCTDKNEECNLDTVTVWAMPDGSIKETVQHTW